MKDDHNGPGLMDALLLRQKQKGMIDDAFIGEAAKSYGLTPEHVLGIIRNHSRLSLKREPDSVIRLCDGTVCEKHGAAELISVVESVLDLEGSSEDRVRLTKNGRIRLELEKCMSLCSKAPFAVINDEIFTLTSPDQLRQLLRAYC